MEVDGVKLREALLERRIEAVKDALNGVRTTWLFATLLTFVIGSVVFNATSSSNQRQITRRAKIVAATNGDLESLKASMEQKNPDGTPTEDAVFLKRVLTSQGSTELGYLHYFKPKSDADSENLDQLRVAARHELQSYVDRRIAFATVQIPLLGVSIASTDIGIVGGLGLIIVGYWLLAQLRREENAFGEFIRKDSSTRNYTSGHSGYTDQESAYAYHSLDHYIVFGSSLKGAPINFLTLTSYLLPPILILINSFSTFVMLCGRRGAGKMLEPHVIGEVIVAVLVLFVWIKAFFYQLHTITARQAWREIIEQKTL